MTLVQLRTRVSQLLAFDLDNFASDASGTVADADLTIQINWALRLLSKKLFLYDPSITLTLGAGTQTYDLRNTSTSSFSRIVLWVHYVIIGGVSLLDYHGTEPGTWTMPQLQKRHDAWRTDSSGTVLRAVQADRALILHPKPSATGSNNFVAGRYMPAALSGDSDVPDIPLELHEILATLAAVKASEPNVSEGEGWERLKRYDAAMVDQIVNAAAQSYASVFGSTEGLERFIGA